MRPWLVRFHLHGRSHAMSPLWWEVGGCHICFWQNTAQLIIWHSVTTERWRQDKVAVPIQSPAYITVLNTDNVVDIVDDRTRQQLLPVGDRLQNVVHGLAVVVCPPTGHPRMDTCRLQLAQTTGTLYCKQIWQKSVNTFDTVSVPLHWRVNRTCW